MRNGRDGLQLMARGCICTHWTAGEAKDGPGRGYRYALRFNGQEVAWLRSKRMTNFLRLQASDRLAAACEAMGRPLPCRCGADAPARRTRRPELRVVQRDA